MSTARADVLDVMVARMRRWNFPCPSWTSDCSFSRIQGMSRLIASSISAWVEGPNARFSARRIRSSRSTRKSNPVLGLDQVVDEPDGELPGLEPNLLLAVVVDDVVLTRAPGAARLPSAGRRAGLALELDRDVLGDVAEPRALLQTLQQAARLAQRARLVLQPRQHLGQRAVEALDGVRRPVLERTEVDEQADRTDRTTSSSVPGRPASRGSSGRARAAASSPGAPAWSGPGPLGVLRRRARLLRTSGRSGPLAHSDASRSVARGRPRRRRRPGRPGAPPCPVRAPPRPCAART